MPLHSPQGPLEVLEVAGEFFEDGGASVEPVQTSGQWSGGGGEPAQRPFHLVQWFDEALVEAGEAAVEPAQGGLEVAELAGQSREFGCGLAEGLPSTVAPVPCAT